MLNVVMTNVLMLYVVAPKNVFVLLGIKNIVSQSIVFLKNRKM